MPIAVGLRHIEPASSRVDAQVLPEIRELQCAANRVRLRERGGIVDAVQVKHQPPHRVGRATAVVQQFGAVGVGVLDNVLLERAEQVREQGHRQSKPRDRAGERFEHRCPAWRGRRAARDRVQIAAVVGQVREPLRGRGIALVGEVVGGAGEPIDRRDGRPQARRAQQRSNRKVLVVIDAHGVHCLR